MSLYFQQVPTIEETINYLSWRDIASFLLCSRRTSAHFGSLLRHNPERLAEEIDVNKACRLGLLTILQVLHARFPYHVVPCFNLMCVAAAHGHLAIIRWLRYKIGVYLSPLVMDVAASHGHLHVVKWLHEYSTHRCTYRAICGAASNGHLDMVQWLHENISDIQGVDAIDLAAEGGHLNVMQWLCANRNQVCRARTLYRAADNGHLDVVQWLLTDWPLHVKNGITLAFNMAARSGHLAVVQCLHATDGFAGCSHHAAGLAETRSCFRHEGHSAVEQWLRANGRCRWYFLGYFYGVCIRCFATTTWSGNPVNEIVLL